MNRRALLIASAAGAAVAIAPAVAAASAAAPEVLQLPTFPAGTKSPPALLEWAAEQLLDGKTDHLVISRDYFKHLWKSNLIDFLPDAEGNGMHPTYYGHLVRVPGSDFV